MADRVSDIWQAYETLLDDCALVVDRPAGTAHPRYPHLFYPLDYGYLAGTTSMDGGGIDVWRGKMKDAGLVAIAVTVDLIKHDSEIKLIINCSEADIAQIDGFHNNSDLFRAKIIRRGNDA